MNGYLFDTDICVFRLRRQFGIDQRILQVGRRSCYISEITVAELRFGAERSNQREKQMLLVDAMSEVFTVLPITRAIRHYATEKARLWNVGQKIPDFDLLIGSTAIVHNLTLITNNVKHFERLQALNIESWIE